MGLMIDREVWEGISQPLLLWPLSLLILQALAREMQPLPFIQRLLFLIPLLGRKEEMTAAGSSEGGERRGVEKRSGPSV